MKVGVLKSFILLSIIIFSFTSFVFAAVETRTFNKIEVESTLPVYGYSPQAGYCSNIETATKDCQLLGYETYVSQVTEGWGVCLNDYAFSWDSGTTWNLISDCNGGGRCNSWIKSLTCSRNLCTPQACSYYSAVCGNPPNGTCSGTLNCGTCTATNAIGTCDASYQCNYSCNSGFTNCDGSWANGCEYNTANFLTDENNCGACGNVCDSGKLCIDGTCGGDNYWADLNSNYITSADLNDYVKVVSYDSPPFDITEDLDPIITINSNAWKANRSTTLGYNVTSDNYGVNATSLLYVSTTDQDDPMIIEVLNPSCGSYYNKGQTIQVRINASDADDIIYGTVKIEGVNIKNFTNLESNIINFSYTFSTAGNIQILVEASNTRGKKFKTISNVMVVDNSPSGDEIQYYVASCIDEPKNYEVFNKALIYFNASSTQGLKYTKSTNNYTIISPLLLLFNWTFYSGQTQKYLTPCSGLGSESCPYDSSGTVIHFYRTFPTINDNYAFLSVSIPNNLMV